MLLTAKKIKLLVQLWLHNETVEFVLHNTYANILRKLMNQSAHCQLFKNIFPDLGIRFDKINLWWSHLEKSKSIYSIYSIEDY